MADKVRGERACDLVPHDIAEDLRSPDARVRAAAVGRICPCRMGFTQFEKHLPTLLQLQKDDSPLVRKAALHVVGEALEMTGSGLPTSPQERKNDMAARKRRLRGLSPDEEDSKMYGEKQDVTGQAGRRRARGFAD